MAEVEELLDEVTVRMPSGAELRARGRRRTVRRRAALVAAAVAVTGGALATAALARGGEGGRDIRPAATPTKNPFSVGGMVRLLPPERMPADGKWQWRGDEEEATENHPLPRVGGSDSCPASYAPRSAPDQIQYGAEYSSDKGATARQRVTSYDSGAVARREVALLEEALTECGLRRHGKGAAGYWSGTTESSSWLRVEFERWGKWVSVVEVEAEEPAREGASS
ncbi:hypothetical protein [Streptomyces alboniger]|uniref:Uncharacterized protein n=1 Tax=Streptomyces alboniger TaxID=132473 RepID=A0A5J6HNB3_STRAD|nr:hypothetical protein [Streptomyces alboniger]QEV20034.1 hypothetical protein CP975_23160 [Streptomyces alboniger]